MQNQNEMVDSKATADHPNEQFVYQMNVIYLKLKYLGRKITFHEQAIKENTSEDLPALKYEPPRGKTNNVVSELV